jgi:hypothetical protein
LAAKIGELICNVLTLTTVEQSMLQFESLLFAASSPTRTISRVEKHTPPQKS